MESLPLPTHSDSLNAQVELQNEPLPVEQTEVAKNTSNSVEEDHDQVRTADEQYDYGYNGDEKKSQSAYLSYVRESSASKEGDLSHSSRSRTLSGQSSKAVSVASQSLEEDVSSGSRSYSVSSKSESVRSVNSRSGTKSASLKLSLRSRAGKFQTHLEHVIKNDLLDNPTILHRELIDDAVQLLEETTARSRIHKLLQEKYEEVKTERAGHYVPTPLTLGGFLFGSYCEKSAYASENKYEDALAAFSLANLEDKEQYGEVSVAYVDESGRILVVDNDSPIFNVYVSGSVFEGFTQVQLKTLQRAHCQKAVIYVNRVKSAEFSVPDNSESTSESDSQSASQSDSQSVSESHSEIPPPRQVKSQDKNQDSGYDSSFSLNPSYDCQKCNEQIPKSGSKNQKPAVPHGSNHQSDDSSESSDLEEYSEKSDNDCSCSSCEEPAKKSVKDETCSSQSSVQKKPVCPPRRNRKSRRNNRSLTRSDNSGVILAGAVILLILLVALGNYNRY